MIGTVVTPAGREARFSARDDTSDSALISGIVGEDEYGLGSLPRLSGWAIDIGAHIGTVSVALALDNPDLSIVAVEALPENVAVLRRNVELNGLGHRVHVLEAAAGAPGETEVPITYGWSRSINQPDNYMHDARFIGGMVGPNETSTTITCPAVSLDTICESREIGPISLLKIDCEGCEWFVLRSPIVARIDLILGEMHEGRNGHAKDLLALLEPTHEVMLEAGNVAHFRAVRRG